MNGFRLNFDAERGVLVLTITPTFRDEDVMALRGCMIDAVAQARKHGPLRFLSDLRSGIAFPADSHEMLWQVLTRNSHPADRVALLLTDSLSKVRARSKTGERGATFASENAAYMWLGAGAHAPV